MPNNNTSINKVETLNRSTSYYQRNLHKILEKHKLYRQTHGKELANKAMSYYYAHQEEQGTRSRNYQRAHRKEIAEKRLQLKIKVLTYYGNGKCACVVCGYDNIGALSLDHTNGGGAKHRHELGGGGNKMYEWIKRNNYPDGYATMCMNDQFLKKQEHSEHGIGKKSVILSQSSIS